MTDNTVLRVQPNSRKNYVLLAIREVSNSKVYGGIRIGDRLKHDDHSQPGPHAFGHVMMIHGANNVEVNGVTMKYGLGDGLHIASIGFTFEAGYVPSKNIKVTNCIFDSNRRNNVSITDGFDIDIDKNTFLRAGIDLPNSEGKAPGFALDIEASRASVNGELVFYEDAHHITIRSNVEKDSKYGSFIVAIGHDVTIENNKTEKAISIGAGYNVTISDNELTANPNNKSSAGIVTGHPDAKDTYNNVISNTTIKGYNVAIAAYQRDTEIYGNNIIDFDIGIQPKNIKNYEIYNNTFTSTVSNSIGIFGNLTTMENVNIYENNLKNVARESFKFVAVNEGVEAENFKITVRNNQLANSGTFSRSNGIDFMNNQTKEGIIFINAKNMSVSGNNIESTGQDAIRIKEGCSNLTIQSNTIKVIGNNLDCIDQTSGGTNITISNNT
ncbi:NosD domain-containing protein [Aquimarina sp. 2201CG1-2-11]|uniref:NosD domain-containing protein n=1 Tax=Aquimarina discodermiae TaxID=3231043 RepID=UPI0034622562